MSGIQGKVIAITGASSGIGEAAARLLAQAGAHVVLGARRTEHLEELTKAIRSVGGTADYHTLDVTKLEQMQQFIQYAHSLHGKIDVIINNAGIMPLSPLASLKVDEWDRMVDVNIKGVLHGIAAGLPLMKEQGYGHFINVASIGAHTVTPTAAVYCATKYAVWALTEGLRQESEEIRATVISPGVTETELANSISDEEARQAMKEYRRISIPAEAIAEAIKYAVEQPNNIDVNEIIVRPTASIG